MTSIYDWFRRHRFAVDFVLMSILWLFAILFSVSDPGLPGFAHHPLMGPIFTTALVVPLAWRRTRTVMAGSIIAAVAVLQWGLGVSPLFGDIAVPLIVYALAAFGPRWASLGGLGLAMLGSIMYVTRYYFEFSSMALSQVPYGIASVLMIWVLVLFSWTSGDLTRTKRLRGQALEDRAHRLEIEAQHERELAASDERAHIAREMHDIVAHSLSVIITQADGARYAAVNNPDIAPETLATIAATGRTSLQEMRRLLGVLRGGDEASTRPLPGLMDLDELLLGMRAAGLPISYSVMGEARRPLPSGAELTAYRVVQESLTNVMKHAGPRAEASVELAWHGRGLDITVSDDGRGAAATLVTQAIPAAAGTGVRKNDVVPPRRAHGSPPPPPLAGGGNGLRGMRERVKLYDGSLTTGPRTGGGFNVKAFIPYSEN